MHIKENKYKNLSLLFIYYFFSKLWAVAADVQELLSICLVEKLFKLMVTKISGGRGAREKKKKT